MSGNHNQNFEKAKKIIDKAAKAGSDAIKLQTYKPDTITINCKNDYFKVKVNKSWKGKTLYDLYKWAYTPWDWQPKLKKYAESKGLIFFSTPFDETAVDFLEELNVQLYKVASFEINHIPLLKKIASTKKPVIMSSGLSSKKDIELAIRTLKNNGCPEVAILHCVSSYPATPEQMNLKKIIDISKRFKVISGLSDHTLTTEISIAAVALGAKIIEKHVTLLRKEGGADSEFSLEPDELIELVKSIRITEKAIGKVTYDISEKEKENIIFRRSIFIVEDIEKGEEFNKKNIKVIRPGHGMHPKFYEKIIGKKAKINLERGTPLNEEDITEWKK
jgi:pseudaminic acid synthase